MDRRDRSRNARWHSCASHAAALHFPNCQRLADFIAQGVASVAPLCDPHQSRRAASFLGDQFFAVVIDQNLCLC